MSGFIKQTFIFLVLVLLSFVRSLAAAKAIKCVSINNQQCGVKLTFIDTNLDKG